MQLLLYPLTWLYLSSWVLALLHFWLSLQSLQGGVSEWQGGADLPAGVKHQHCLNGNSPFLEGLNVFLTSENHNFFFTKILQKNVEIGKRWKINSVSKHYSVWYLWIWKFAYCKYLSPGCKAFQASQTTTPRQHVKKRPPAKGKLWRQYSISETCSFSPSLFLSLPA